MKKWIDLLKKTYTEWSEDNCLQIGAALSFYTLSSLIPLLLVIASVLSVFLTSEGGQRYQQQIIDYLANAIGSPDFAAQLTEGLTGADQSRSSGGIVGAVVGFATLLFTASGVFSQLDTAFDDIWDVPEEAKPTGIIGTLKAKFFSFGLVLAVAFILLVSTILTGVVTQVTDRLSQSLPAGGLLAILVTYAVQLAIISLVFALLFKYLPSTKVEWRDVAVGGLITAVLWLVGQSLLNFYLTRSSFSSYGLIGGVLAFLVYVYYSSQIAFIGGEFTQVYARSHGSMAQPEGQAADAAGATANQPSAVNRALAEARKRELLRKEQELSQAQRRTRSTAASSGAVGLLVGAVLGGVALVVGVARTVGRLRGGGA